MKKRRGEKEKDPGACVPPTGRGKRAVVVMRGREKRKEREVLVFPIARERDVGGFASEETPRGGEKKEVAGRS